jgi:hypothetical protein
MGHPECTLNNRPDTIVFSVPNGEDPEVTKKLLFFMESSAASGQRGVSGGFKYKIYKINDLLYCELTWNKEEGDHGQCLAGVIKNMFPECYNRGLAEPPTIDKMVEKQRIADTELNRLQADSQRRVAKILNLFKAKEKADMGKIHYNQKSYEAGVAAWEQVLQIEFYPAFSRWLSDQWAKPDSYVRGLVAARERDLAIDRANSKPQALLSITFNGEGELMVNNELPCTINDQPCLIRCEDGRFQITVPAVSGFTLPTFTIEGNTITFNKQVVFVSANTARRCGKPKFFKKN